MKLPKLYDRRHPEYRRDWASLKKAGIFALRCGCWSRRTNKECSLPQGHRGKHDLVIVTNRPASFSY